MASYAEKIRENRQKNKAVLEELGLKETVAKLKQIPVSNPVIRKSLPKPQPKKRVHFTPSKPGEKRKSARLEGKEVFFGFLKHNFADFISDPGYMIWIWILKLYITLLNQRIQKNK